MAGTRWFQAASAPGTGVPAIGQFTATGGQTFKTGAIVKLSSGLLVEDTAGAGALTILGVALAPAFSAPGYDAANSPTVVTGRSGYVSVALADGNTIFSGRGVNGGTDPVTPVVATHIGVQYGLAVDGAGVWYIDIANVTNLAVVITGVDIDQKIFYFRFIAAVRQIAV
jgi:hypothetical protein